MLSLKKEPILYSSDAQWGSLLMRQTTQRGCNRPAKQESPKKRNRNYFRAQIGYPDLKISSMKEILSVAQRFDLHEESECSFH